MTTSAITIPVGYALRRPTRDDIPAIIQLIHDFDVAVLGEADTFTPDDILSDWRHGNPDTDAWIVESQTPSRIAAYATVIDQGFGRIGTDAYVHPDHWGRGIGTLLVRLTEDRAHQLMPNAPAGAQVTLANGISLKDEAARRLLESAGYALARSYSLMRIVMDAPPSPPEWPDGVTLRTMVPGQDERAVFACMEDSFADHWGHVPRQFDEWIARTEREDFDPTLWFLVFDGDQLAGACLCLTRPDDGWVNTLGVRRPWRQRGLGMALLLYAFGAFYRRGVHSVALMVDAQSLTGATRLYERAGMAVSAQFGLYQKELRPGVDLSTQALVAERD
jgi:mycothiol synthase